MKSLFSILVFLALFSTQTTAQKIYDKVAKQACKCLEKEETVNKEAAESCLKTAMLGNLQAILEANGAKDPSDVSGTEVASNIMSRLLEKCDAFKEAIREKMQEDLPTYEADPGVSCEGLATGNYYYLSPNSTGDLTDTVYVTHTDTYAVERTLGGREYVMHELKWVDACTFTLSMIESNGVKWNALPKGERTTTFTVISNSEEAIVVQAERFGIVQQVKMIRLR